MCVQGFPFALVSIHISKWVADLLDAGLLNRAAITCGNMVEACDRWYVGTFYRFSVDWGRKPLPVQEMSGRMQWLEKLSKKRIAAMITASGQSLKATVKS